MDDMQKTVLLVDDDAQLLRGLERNLADKNYDVLTAVSAAEAMAVLKQHEVHAVICDNQMPGTSGTQFLSIVRRDHPNVVRVMLTGCISPTDAWKVVNDIGVYRLFTKPCNALELAIAIRQGIEIAASGVARAT